MANLSARTSFVSVCRNDSFLGSVQQRLARPFGDLLASFFGGVFDLVPLVFRETEREHFLGFAFRQFRTAHFIFLFRHTNSC